MKNIIIVLITGFVCCHCSQKSPFGSIRLVNEKQVFDAKDVNEKILKSFDLISTEEFTQLLGYENYLDYFDSLISIYAVCKRKIDQETEVIILYYKNAYHAHIFTSAGYLSRNLTLSAFSDDPYYEYSAEIDSNNIIKIIEHNDCKEKLDKFKVEGVNFTNVEHTETSKQNSECNQQDEYDPR